MPILHRPDGEIHYQVHGAGFPVLRFAPGGLRSRLEMSPAPTFLLPGTDIPHPVATSTELAALLPGVEVLEHWRGPEHLAEQESRVAAFLIRHTPHA
jgi:hypothetical protein